MKMRLTRIGLFAGALTLITPGAVIAHEGHAGDHGWLAGALQPLLSPDHFLAALLIVLVGAVGVTGLAVSRTRSRAMSPPPPAGRARRPPG